MVKNNNLNRDDIRRKSSRNSLFNNRQVQIRRWRSLSKADLSYAETQLINYIHNTSYFLGNEIKFILT